MKKLLAGFIGIILAPSAFAASFSGSGYSVTFDDPNLQFDGTKITKAINYSASYGNNVTYIGCCLMIQEYNHPDDGLPHEGIVNDFSVGFSLNPGYSLRNIILSINAQATGFATRQPIDSSGVFYAHLFGLNVDGLSGEIISGHQTSEGTFTHGGIFDESFNHSWLWYDLPPVIDFRFVADALGYNSQTTYHIDSFSIQFVTERITTAVPEPSTYAMLGLGLGIFGFAARRHKSS